MNPALLIVILLTGSALLVAGVLAAVLGWLPLVPAIVVAVVGGAIEAGAVLAYARSRRQSR